MNVTEAIEHLIQSDFFIQTAKSKESIGSRYRMFSHRYKSGQLRLYAILTFLLEHGYEMEFTAPELPFISEMPRRSQRLNKRNFGPVSIEKNGTVDWEQLQKFMVNSKK